MVYPLLNPCPDSVVGKTDLVLVAVQGAPPLFPYCLDPYTAGHVTSPTSALRLVLFALPPTLCLSPPCYGIDTFPFASNFLCSAHPILTAEDSRIAHIMSAGIKGTKDHCCT